MFKKAILLSFAFFVASCSCSTISDYKHKYEELKRRYEELKDRYSKLKRDYDDLKRKYEHLEKTPIRLYEE